MANVVANVVANVMANVVAYVEANIMDHITNIMDQCCGQCCGNVVLRPMLWQCCGNIVAYFPDSLLFFAFDPLTYDLVCLLLPLICIHSNITAFLLCHLDTS